MMDMYKLPLYALLLAGTSIHVHADGVDLKLEPCINGGVSASGLYETQVLEDAASHNNNYAISFEEDSIGDGTDDVISAYGGNRDDFLR